MVGCFDLKIFVNCLLYKSCKQLRPYLTVTRRDVRLHTFIYVYTIDPIFYDCMHNYAGQVKASHTILELKLHLHPTQTCGNLLVSYVRMMSI